MKTIVTHLEASSRLMLIKPWLGAVLLNKHGSPAISLSSFPIQKIQWCHVYSGSAHVIGIVGESKLGNHQVGEAERHEAINFCQPVQTVGSLKEVFRTVPHTLVPTAGFLFQVAEIHGFYKDP